MVANDHANHVKSINSSVNPESDLDSHRISLRWMPTDDLDIQFMRQKTDRDRRAFTPVAGDGTDLTAVTGVNGPLIKPEDRLAVGEFPGDMTNDMFINTLNVSWQVLNHEINYVGSRSQVLISGLEPRDLGNVFNGEVYTSHNSLENNVETHELRLSSAEPYAEFLDYSVGLFRSKTWGGNDIVYGSQPINTEYLERQDAVFASLTFYLTDATEFTVGGRHIQAEKHSVYDLGVIVDNRDEESANVYKLSLSHRFSDDLLTYVNWGTSWRMGPTIVGLRSTDVTNPQYKAMTDLDSEESRGWEVGVKVDFMDGRGRVNAAVFSQDFENYIYRSKPTDFLTYLGTVDQHAFTTNADASVKGVEIDTGFQITSNWNVSASASWYDSKLKSEVPCIIGETNPAQFRADGVIAYFCSIGGAITFDPDWTASVQSEYSRDLTASLNGYVRGLYSYYPKNDNQHELTDIDAYGLFNLYLEVRDEEAGWEVQLFAKNLFNEGSVTFLSDSDVDANLARSFSPTGSSGYRESGYTPPREVGLNFRYNFNM